jgi:ActR/RegA family two-component response regulator
MFRRATCTSVAKDHVRYANDLATALGDHRRATFMLVEDDVVLGQTLAKVLEFAGYRVRIAATGRKAYALQRRVRPDLIILDLMQPDTDGLPRR